MTATPTRRRATPATTPAFPSPGGADPRPTIAPSTPDEDTSGGSNDTRRATEDAQPELAAPAGHNSHPTTILTSPVRPSSGGSQLADRRHPSGTQRERAASDQPTDRQKLRDTQNDLAVGATGGQGPADVWLLDPALALAADVLDDLERVRIANANRLRILTTSEADSDGETRGFGLDNSHPDVARLAAIVDMLGKVEHDATLNLQRHMRRHPLSPWAKGIRGAGEKQVARLLATIGDPYWRDEIVREDGTVIPAGPRTVSALWAYTGLHVLPAGGHEEVDNHHAAAAGRDQPPTDSRMTIDTQVLLAVGGVQRAGGDSGRGALDAQDLGAGVAARRQRGQKANWSTRAKTKAYLIATSFLKQLVKPCHNPGDGPTVHVEDCRCSPYRIDYDHRRAHTAKTHPDWTDGHSHNDALRIAAKAFLRDMWREAKRIHEQGRP